MDYIINPSWFYWIEVADTIKGISIGAIVILIIACIILAIMVGMDRALGEDTEGKVHSAIFCKCLIALAVFTLVCVLVPSKQALMEMQIAKLATRSNVDLTIEKVKEIADYIIDAMKELK